MRKYILLIAAFLMINSGCSVFQQASEMSRISKCEFKINNLTNINLSGINIDNKDSFNDFSVFDIATLSSALSTGELPLSFTVNLLVRNPDPNKAAMNRMDWILLVDGNEMMNGVLNQRYEIPGNGGTASVPVMANIDLLEAFSGKNLESLVNFGLNLAGTGSNPTKVTMKIKPSIVVNSRTIDYPGYININTEFSSGQGL